MIQEVRNLARGAVAIALAACLFAADPAPPVVIQLRVVEGDGAIYSIGSRATRGLSILVSDEAGKPVEGAAVSFQLPSDGPTGTFAGGNRNQIVTTKTDGIASIWGMQWNKTAGVVEVRVTASKGQARAGVAVIQHLSDGVKPGGEGTFTASHHERNKWLLIGGAVAGGAAAGMYFRGSMSKSSTSTTPATVPLQVGNPSSIVVGHP